MVPNDWTNIHRNLSNMGINTETIEGIKYKKNYPSVLLAMAVNWN